MTNEERLVAAFAEVLGIGSERIVDQLEYNSIPEWDSAAHMTLVAELETTFDVMLDTDDILDMSSVGKAKEILAKYDIAFS